MLIFNKLENKYSREQGIIQKPGFIINIMFIWAVNNISGANKIRRVIVIVEFRCYFVNYEA